MSIRARLRLPPDPSQLPNRLTGDGWWLLDARPDGGRIDGHPPGADHARLSRGPAPRADAPPFASETVP